MTTGYKLRLANAIKKSLHACSEYCTVLITQVSENEVQQAKALKIITYP